MSLTDNRYWRGGEHAVLRRENVTADWVNGNFSNLRIDAANRAFCIWYHACQTLNNSAGEAHYGQMRQTLFDCGRAGWGFGVKDLEDALDHMARNNGRWSDGNTGVYMGGPGKAYNRALIQDVPEACRNFLNAVDSELPRMQGAVQEYQTRCQALQQLRPTSTQSTTDWERLRSQIDLVKTSAERARPLMWLAPAVVQANVPNTQAGWSAVRKVEAFADGGLRHISRSVKFLDVVGNIHDSMTVYVEASRALGGDRRAGLAFASLSYAMTFVPVLGTFYGTIVRKIPGMITDWRDFMRDYTRRFDDPEGWMRARSNRQPAWRCATCGSSGGHA